MIVNILLIVIGILFFNLGVVLYVAAMLYNKAEEDSKLDAYRTMEKFRLDRGWKSVPFKGSWKDYTNRVLNDCEERERMKNVNKTSSK